MNRRALLREAAAFAFFLALAVFFSWPLAIRLSTGVSDAGDPFLNAWILHWDCYAFLHQPLHLFAAPVFEPAHLPLAYSEHMAGIALFVFPFYLAGASAIALHGIAVILGFALSGYGAYVLARTVTRHTPAALMAGIFHAFCSFRISHLPHVQILWSGWLPLILAALIAFNRKPTRRNAALFAAAFAMNGLTNIYFLLFSGVTVLLTVWLFAIAERKDAAYWRRLLGALAVAALVLLPFLVPYAIVSNEYHMTRMGEEALSGSATWSDWLVPAGNNALYGALPAPGLARAERLLFPGFVPLLMLIWSAVAMPPLSDRNAERRHGRRTPDFLDVLIVVAALLSYLALVRGGLRPFLPVTGSDVPLMLLAVLIVIRLTPWIREKLQTSRFPIEAWAAAVWIAAGVLGSFGRNGFFGEFLFRRTMIFRSLRALARFAVISYAGLAVWMAIGIVALLAMIPRPALRRVVVALLFAATLADVWPEMRWEYPWFPPTEAQLWLRDHGRASGGSTLELPMTRWGSNYQYMLGATIHHAPIMNGTSGFEPPVHEKLRLAEESFRYDEDFLRTMESNGCALLLVHGDYCGNYGPSLVKWLAQNLATGRITFLRRFERGVLGDWLFAVTRNARIRGVQSDPALNRFLAGEMTYNASTFGRMDQPKPAQEVKGPLLVTGWALSPEGIRSATVLIDAGRVRVPATLSAREDVSRSWPWYPKTPYPAFTATIAKRPPGVNRVTEVQVEVVDGAGRVTRFNDARVIWDE